MMSLSACEKCWDTPCTCGWQYREYSIDAKMQLVSAVLGDVPNRLLALIRNTISKDKDSKNKVIKHLMKCRKMLQDAQDSLKKAEGAFVCPCQYCEYQNFHIQCSQICNRENGFNSFNEVES